MTAGVYPLGLSWICFFKVYFASMFLRLFYLDIGRLLKIFQLDLINLELDIETLGGDNNFII